jgi:oligosaccharide repeat unit polymerase
VSVVYSGGVPIVWSMTGSAKSYSDFGIPTVGGLSVLLRSVCATLCIVLFLATGRKLYLLYWLVLFLDCVSEVSRSALFMFSCQSLAAFLLLQKVKLRHLLLSLVVLTGLLGMFIFLGSLRGIQMNASDFQVAAFGNLPEGVYWAWAYVVSPLGNVNYATTLGITPLYFPANTFGALLPSVIGSAVGLRVTHYPIQLASDSLNATSMYAPLIADFGVFGATFLMAMFQAIASYAYVMARRGSFLFIVVYPALFGCLVLSIFFIYAGSLQIILVPAVALWARRFYRRHRAQAAGMALSGAARDAV